MYVCQLSKEKQDALYVDVVFSVIDLGLPAVEQVEAIQNAMNSKLSDLSDLIDIRKYQ
jgi:hypothetical protein